MMMIMRGGGGWCVWFGHAAQCGNGLLRCVFFFFINHQKNDDGIFPDPPESMVGQTVLHGQLWK
jgi:hypothetical protein